MRSGGLQSVQHNDKFPPPSDSGAFCLKLSNWTGVASKFWFASSICTLLFLSCYLQTFSVGARVLHTMPWTLFETVTVGRYFLGARFGPVGLDL